MGGGGGSAGRFLIGVAGAGASDATGAGADAAAGCVDGELSSGFASLCSASARVSLSSVFVLDASSSGRFFNDTAFVLVTCTNVGRFAPNVVKLFAGERLDDVRGLTVALAVVAIISEARGLSEAFVNLGDDLLPDCAGAGAGADVGGLVAVSGLPPLELLLVSSCSGSELFLCDVLGLPLRLPLTDALALAVSVDEDGGRVGDRLGPAETNSGRFFTDANDNASMGPRFFPRGAGESTEAGREFERTDVPQASHTALRLATCA